MSRLSQSRPRLYTHVRSFPPLYAEFSDASVSESPVFKALEAWYGDAIDPMVDYRSFRTFGLHQEYETTAALKAMK